MEYKTVFVLGRQPAIGRAELESLYGDNHVKPAGEMAMFCDIPTQDIAFDRIGGAMRLGSTLGTVESTQWSAVSRAAAMYLNGLLDYVPAEGKVKIGLSSFGFDITAARLLQTGLELKKVCRKQGHSARIIPNTDPALNSAQVLYNQLTKELGIELLFIKDGNQTHIARTIAIQDIDAYAKRDQGRPKRDAFVGMLPPKLAQTIVNLAVGPLPTRSDTVVLDPFCGTGVILQEALLMGFGAYGTDLEPRMIAYSRTNLEWLATHGVNTTPLLDAGDATAYHWQPTFKAVASETYLGRPLSTWPEPQKLHDIIFTCNTIIRTFLSNLAKQTTPGLRLCLAVPAWQAPDGTLHHLPVLDQIEVLGYNRVSFSWAQMGDIIYHRPDQLVARELVVLTRK